MRAITAMAPWMMSHRVQEPRAATMASSAVVTTRAITISVSRLIFGWRRCVVDFVVVVGPGAGGVVGVTGAVGGAGGSTDAGGVGADGGA